MKKSTYTAEKSIPPDQIYRPDVDTSKVDERKLMRRVDIHVIPWLTFVYLLNFLDRGSIGNAKLYNLERDLKITDNQYLVALTVFFFPYALFEPASNVFLRRLRPSVWLSIMLFLWGVVMVCLSLLNGAVSKILGRHCTALYIIMAVSLYYEPSSDCSRPECTLELCFIFRAGTNALRWDPEWPCFFLLRPSLVHSVVF